MSRVHAPGSNAPSGLLGTLWSWLHARSTDFWPPAKAESGLPVGPVAHDYGPVRVLVVDDNPVNLMVVSAMMESRGFVPLLASDGAEAVALACELHFDLILMDLQMPILDGLGATDAIRRFEAAGSRSTVPVVAYTTTSPGRAILAAHGISGSLSKPCTDEDLEACLVQWCPTYRPAPTLRSAANDPGGWPAAIHPLGSNIVVLRPPRA